MKKQNSSHLYIFHQTINWHSYSQVHWDMFTCIRSFNMHSCRFDRQYSSCERINWDNYFWWYMFSWCLSEIFFSLRKTFVYFITIRWHTNFIIRFMFHSLCLLIMNYIKRILKINYKMQIFSSFRKTFIICYEMRISKEKQNQPYNFIDEFSPLLIYIVVKNCESRFEIAIRS